MIVWRLARKKYIRDLSGEGARMHGGRWNHKGTPMLYTSGHCSLALLEILANTSKALLPNDLYQLQLNIPDFFEVTTFKKESLPSNWRQYPAPVKLAELGSTWCKNEQSAVLKVPSVLVSEEWNHLLNPMHKHFKECKIINISPFDVDFRLEEGI